MSATTTAVPAAAAASIALKIRKPAGGQPDALELTISKLLTDMENTQGSDLSRELKALHFTAAKEVDMAAGRRAIVLLVPVPQLKAYQKIHLRLVRELEKKFSDKHVIIIADRKIISRTARVQQKRPRSRTLTSVHEAILNEMVFPTEIVGKRTRVNVDGSRLIKVHLDHKDKSTMEHKLATFTAVYAKLTGKNAVFSFAEKIEA